MLVVSRLFSSYGAIRAVRDVSLSVGPGRLVALIGSNGAGKSTTLKTIAGLQRAESGSVTLDGRAVTGWPAYRVVREGMTLVPEGRMVIAPLTVDENLRMSAFARRGSESVLLDRVFELFPRLRDRRKQIAGSLSGGEQQMLAVARAMMTDPKVLLLDEPSMGLAPIMVDTVFQAIDEIHKAGQAILLVEQNAALALTIADNAYVLQRGEIVLEGTPKELADRPEVMAAYLG